MSPNETSPDMRAGPPRKETMGESVARSMRELEATPFTPEELNALADDIEHDESWAFAKTHAVRLRVTADALRARLAAPAPGALGESGDVRGLLRVALARVGLARTSCPVRLYLTHDEHATLHRYATVPTPPVREAGTVGDEAKALRLAAQMIEDHVHLTMYDAESLPATLRAMAARAARDAQAACTIDCFYDRQRCNRRCAHARGEPVPPVPDAAGWPS